MSSMAAKLAVLAFAGAALAAPLSMEALAGPITVTTSATVSTTLVDLVVVTATSSSAADAVSTSVVPVTPVPVPQADVQPAAAPAPAPAPVAAPAAAPAPSPVQASAGAPAPATGKRGIPYNDIGFTSTFEGTKAGAWAYNWGQTADGLSSSFNYVPMLWGTKAFSTWEANAKAAISSGSTHLLGFNEPDNEGQANMSPGEAAANYKTYMSDMFGGAAQLGAPAVTNGGAPMGLAWLSSFMGACSGCQIDFVPIHWYDSASNIQYFQSFVQQAHQQSGKPIWITEFGATGSDAEISSFFETILPWLDSQDYVERYSYFMASDGKLNSGSGQSAYGQTYANA